MELITKLENMVAKWLKPIPSLPKSAQKWLAANVWWLALISAILTGLSILFSIGAIATYASLSASADALYGSIGLVSYGAGWIVGAVITLIFSIVIAGVTALAVSPLKAQSRKGWTLLFLVLLLSALEVVVNAIVSFSVIGFIFAIIFGAIGLAIGGYFLFQIQSYFSSAKAKHIAK
jgi:hypothetical protein